MRDVAELLEWVFGDSKIFRIAAADRPIRPMDGWIAFSIVFGGGLILVLIIAITRGGLSLAVIIKPVVRRRAVRTGIAPMGSTGIQPAKTFRDGFVHLLVRLTSTPLHSIGFSRRWGWKGLRQRVFGRTPHKLTSAWPRWFFSAGRPGPHHDIACGECVRTAHVDFRREDEVVIRRLLLLFPLSSASTIGPSVPHTDCAFAASASSLLLNCKTTF